MAYRKDFTVTLEQAKHVRPRVERIEELFNVEVKFTSSPRIAERTGQEWIEVSGNSNPDCENSKKYVQALTNPESVKVISVPECLVTDLERNSEYRLKQYEREYICAISKVTDTKIVLKGESILLVEDLLTKRGNEIQKAIREECYYQDGLEHVSMELKEFAMKLGFNMDDIALATVQCQINDQPVNENTLLKELLLHAPEGSQVSHQLAQSFTTGLTEEGTPAVMASCQPPPNDSLEAARTTSMPAQSPAIAPAAVPPTTNNDEPETATTAGLPASAPTAPTSSTQHTPDTPPQSSSSTAADQLSAAQTTLPQTLVTPYLAATLAKTDASKEEEEKDLTNNPSTPATSSPAMCSVAQSSASESTTATNGTAATFVAISRVEDPSGEGAAEIQLRDIVIDGSNVAMCHGSRDVFSCRGIEIAINWFRRRGHTHIVSLVPQWRKEINKPDAPIVDQEVLLKLEKEKLLFFTPSRKLIDGRRVTCYDDKFILKYASTRDSIIVSNDNFRDLQKENPQWKSLIEQRLLMFSFINDIFMPPDDPLGRHGPNLETFLQKGSMLAKPCPYKSKCTYGNKCRFFHPPKPAAEPAKATATASTGAPSSTSTQPELRTADDSKTDKTKTEKPPSKHLQMAGSVNRQPSFSQPHQNGDLGRTFAASSATADLSNMRRHTVTVDKHQTRLMQQQQHQQQQGYYGAAANNGYPGRHHPHHSMNGMHQQPMSCAMEMQRSTQYMSAQHYEFEDDIIARGAPPPASDTASTCSGDSDISGVSGVSGGAPRSQQQPPQYYSAQQQQSQQPPHPQQPPQTRFIPTVQVRPAFTLPPLNRQPAAPQQPQQGRAGPPLGPQKLSSAAAQQPPMNPTKYYATSTNQQYQPASQPGQQAAQQYQQPGQQQYPAATGQQAGQQYQAAGQGHQQQYPTGQQGQPTAQQYYRQSPQQQTQQQEQWVPVGYYQPSPQQTPPQAPAGQPSTPAHYMTTYQPQPGQGGSAHVVPMATVAMSPHHNPMNYQQPMQPPQQMAPPPPPQQQQQQRMVPMQPHTAPPQAQQQYYSHHGHGRTQFYEIYQPSNT